MLSILKSKPSTPAHNIGRISALAVAGTRFVRGRYQLLAVAGTRFGRGRYQVWPWQVPGLAVAGINFWLWQVPGLAVAGTRFPCGMCQVCTPRGQNIIPTEKVRLS